MNMIFSTMQLVGLIMILNFVAVQGCRFDMKFNERVRVCSQCKNKEVVGKFHWKRFTNWFQQDVALELASESTTWVESFPDISSYGKISARRTPWAQALFRETCFQLRRGGCCATQHFQNIYNQGRSKTFIENLYLNSSVAFYFQCKSSRLVIESYFVTIKAICFPCNEYENSLERLFPNVFLMCKYVNNNSMIIPGFQII